MHTNIKQLLGILIIAFIALTPAEAFGAHPKHHKNKGKKEKCGPPDWAPAHGYRAKQRHIYYPEQNVYYDTQREVYIYVDMGRWEVGARLPLPLRNVQLNRATSVRLDIESDYPQRYNDYHRRRY